ncbi:MULTISPECIES: AI-2E family transporter [Streptomyces]|uniref:AI-2E family transporter n=1 Tax=Streptomyces TaxID=1883 RepID=UPI00163D21FA|nr:MULTISPECIES: AI-2E family transporter [Streptomyces]MBC2875230.1 AI-2E family transporter [Streptomyces sp. TYQ1024]UBI37057.1 AI-2E family transporter [Streptomyces mobaraensis]UKW29651.1 AI-2E family transporter [Streptomyces sp. TYQ1024]
MSRLPQWLDRVGSGLTRLSQRLEERKARTDPDGVPAWARPPAGDSTPGRPVHEPADGGAAAPGPVGPAASEPGAPAAPSRTGSAESVASAEPSAAAPDEAPAPGTSSASADRTPPPSAAAVLAEPPRPDPVSAVPWGVRVAAEAGWRLLVLAGTLWVLMRVISAVQLVVLAFVAGLLITALLQPTVATLVRRGLPRGLAAALTFISGFVIMGLVGWFVVWQVMDNADDLSGKLETGLHDLKEWLRTSPFHVTQDQIDNITDNLTKALRSNTDEITSAGIQGVQVIIETLTGIVLAMFTTLFLLYDGPRIWRWVLRLVPSAAREGVAGAGPRAWATLTAYVRGTVIVAMIDAICIGIGLYFLKVPMAVPLAVFIFLFAFIPLVGAVVSGALAVVVALVTEGVFTATMVLVVVLAVQQIEGHVLQPFILGRAVRVHPLAVVLSVAAGSMIAGIGGAVVAVPLVAVTNTVVGYLKAYSRGEVPGERLE